MILKISKIDINKKLKRYGLSFIKDWNKFSFVTFIRVVIGI